jgi:Fanconi-associated nuclease 1
MSLLNFFETERPALKRIKRSDSDIQSSTASGERSRSVSGEDSEKGQSTPWVDFEDLTPASDAYVASVLNEDDEALPKASQTELETTLPPIESNREAIEQYEASRAAETEEELSLAQKFGERKWQKGRSSIYVDAFNLALETVLEEEAPLFDQSELAVFEKWRALSYEAQYL